MYRRKEDKKQERLGQLVVKGNELIQRKRYSLTATQQKFLAYVISLIKPTDTINTKYEIRVEDFCNTCGIDKSNFYTDFIKMIDKFDENSFWVDTKEELYKFRWFTDTRYVKGSGMVELYLSRSLKEYLIDLMSNFTQYELYNVMALHSKYAIRLFELFKSYQYQDSKTFDIDELKYLLYAENYKNFNTFNLRVLEPALSEINKYTELEVSYNTIHKGRKVVAVEFNIELKRPFERMVAYQTTMKEIDRNNKGK